jgi:hypothetical protein
MRTNIYDLYHKSFLHSAGYVIVKDGQKVATVAFKFPADGAGRIYCYFHVSGATMVRSYAGGYGYNKQSAACESAVAAITAVIPPEYQAHIDAFKAALDSRPGYEWERRIREAGYEVWQIL